MTCRGPLVQDVMTPDPMVVHEEDPAEALLVLFEQRDFNAVPVVDAERHLVGVVTKLSLLRLFRRVTGRGVADPGELPSLQVRDVVDARAVWVEPSDALDAVVHRMTRHYVRSVPVVERSGRRRRLVGMVSWGDLLRGLAPGELESSGDG